MGIQGNEDGAYDAQTAPDAAYWFEMDEAERVDAVEAYHEASDEAHADTPNPRIHATIHVVVENQLAMNDPAEARPTIDRLVGEGMSRHDAIHAVGTVVAHSLHQALQDDKRSFDAETYRLALSQLSSKK